MFATALVLLALQGEPVPTVTVTPTNEPTPTVARHHHRGMVGRWGTATAAAEAVATVHAREAAFPRIYLPAVVRPRLRQHTAILPLLVSRR